MADKTLTFQNPNARALTIPQQEGATPDDRYFGSIGDATMRHVSSLSDADRMLWEDLYCPKSGAIFRTVPSTSAYDPDPMHLRGKDLESYKKRYEGKVSAAELAVVMEAIEVEAERRENSEDVADLGELVPFDQWEQNPQMWNHIDIPSTPRDIYIYMGDCNQQYYDDFPTGHPDEGRINQCINILNREYGLDIDEGYCKFAQGVVNSWKFRHSYVRVYLLDMISTCTYDEGDIDEQIISTLKRIDRHWQVDSVNYAAKKALQDKMTKLLLHKKKEWEEASSKGFNVYSSVKSFGQVLFRNYRDNMKNYHWAWYRNMRNEYVPGIMIRGIDINRCSPKDLQHVLRIPRVEATKIWCDRPFKSIDEAYNKGYIKAGSFSDDEKTDRVIGFIEKHANIAKKNLDMKRLDDVRKELIKCQRGTKLELASDQWNMIWRYYRILKTELTGLKNAAKKEKGEANVVGQ